MAGVGDWSGDRNAADLRVGGAERRRDLSRFFLLVIIGGRGCTEGSSQTSQIAATLCVDSQGASI
jgi:hypothetical protein